ncbi:sulfite exporter TauE/SafE family protein [Kordiimonas pumila]|uniref:Probable membrane transporter protein n=1 Tax=Kordiimonas pumila TaxID=2161677 RepID=A0ABV7D206_9PROT|nr:sulfite exporter TauE/SafE family protein [Kordiimonas pumila]
MIEILIDAFPLIVAGAGAGFLAGLLGIGGGIVTIPALFIVFEGIGIPIEWRMHCAIATSLTIIIATSISSVHAHNKKGGVDWSIMKDWWWPIMLGALAGSFFAKTLKTETLVYIFAAFATLVGLKMLLPLDKIKLGDKLPGGVFRFLNPGIIGFLSAIKGIGGGSFSVPYMTLYGVPIHRAVGTSSLAGLFISTFGGLGYFIEGRDVEGLPEGMAGFIHIPSVIVVASVAVFFAPLGAKAAHAIPRKILSILFGSFLVLATLRLILTVH